MPTSLSSHGLALRLPRSIVPTGSTSLKERAHHLPKSLTPTSSTTLVKPHLHHVHKGLSCPSTPTAAPPPLVSEKCLHLKEKYHKDLSMLIEDVTRFNRETITAPQDEAVKARAHKIEIFLRYVSNTLTELEQATESNMPQVEEKIKTTLLPLKEKLVAQYSAMAAVVAEHDTPLLPEVASCHSLATTCEAQSLSGSRSEDGWLTDTSGEADVDAEGEDGGFDEFDLQHLEMLIDDDNLELSTLPRFPLLPDDAHEEDCSMTKTFPPCSSQVDNMTDSASLILDSEPSTPKRSIDSVLVEVKSEVVIPPQGMAPEEDQACCQSLKRPRVSEEEVTPALKEVATPEVVSAPVPVVVPPQPQPSQAPAVPAFNSSSNSRNVEYQCTSCSETYPTAIGFNPWWAMIQEECPKCHKLQVPRIDISQPANAIEYHPALLAEEGEEDSDDDTCLAGAVADFTGLEEENEPENEEEEWSMEPAQASKLMVLLSHAATCPGHHKSHAHGEVCRSTKFLMLHVRDCDGRLLDGTPCTMPWCLPCKQVLGHMARCMEGESCPVCHPKDLPKQLEDLRCLNQQRLRVVTDDSAMSSSSSLTEPEDDAMAAPLWADLEDDIGLSHEDLQLCTSDDIDHTSLMLADDDLIM